MEEKICVVVGGAMAGKSLVEEYAGRRYYIAFMDTDKEHGKLLKEKIEKDTEEKCSSFTGMRIVKRIWSCLREQ